MRCDVLNIHDTTRLLEGWVASQQGWRIDVLAASSLSQFRPEPFDGKTLLVCSGEKQTLAQQQQLCSRAQDATSTLWRLKQQLTNCLMYTLY